MLFCHTDHTNPSPVRLPALRVRTAAILLYLALLTSGCGSTVIPATHGYLLVRTSDAALTPVSDDDPLYTAFEQQVLQDAYLRSLLNLFEHTTEAYVATNTSNALSQTVHNYPILVLDSATPGVLHDIELSSSGAAVSIERALGLGYDGTIDLDRAQEDLAPTSALWLLELVGVSTSPWGDQIALDQPTDAEVALSLGLAAAVDVLHTLDRTSAEGTASERAIAAPTDDARRQAILSGAYAYRWADGHSTAQHLPRAEAVRTPGAAATFFYRLLQQTEMYYPQRYMLWFVNYAGSEMPLAKTLRVCQRLALEHRVDIETFITYYVETFPAERTAVLSLADQVFGQSEDRDGVTP